MDKDYISGIVISVNAAKTASDEAKKASDNISKTIEALKATVKKISDFQKEVRGDITSLKAKAGIKDKAPEHIDDIDIIWKDVQAHRDLLGRFEEQLLGIQTSMSVVNDFKDNLDKLNHLIDIDELWNEFQDHYKNYETFYNRFVKFYSDYESNFKAHRDEITRLSIEQKQTSDLFQAYSSRIDKSLSSFLSKINDFQEYSDKLISRNSELISDLQSEYDSFHAEFHNYYERANEDVKNIQESIYAINQYTDILKSFSHLCNIDTMWQDLDTQKKVFAGFKEEFMVFNEKTCKIISDIQSDVSILKLYKTQLERFEYLPKIDELWDFSHLLSDRIVIISDTVDKHSKDLVRVHTDLEGLDTRFNAKSTELSHKIRLNNIIVASTLILVLLSFILNIFNVL